MTKFGLYTKFISQDGQRDSLADILMEAANGMKSCDGCDLYVVNIPEDEPNEVWVTEVWSNPIAHQESLSLDQSKTLIRKARPLIAGVEQMKLRVLGGKGI